MLLATLGDSTLLFEVARHRLRRGRARSCVPARRVRGATNTSYVPSFRPLATKERAASILNRLMGGWPANAACGRCQL